MTDTNTLFHFVADTGTSARFYADLFGRGPIEASPGFALVILPSGLPLGLWQKDGVTPPPAAVPGGSELGFKVATPAEVDATHADWAAKGAAIALAPTDLDFGRSFVALDPDGNRLRVYAMFD